MLALLLLTGLYLFVLPYVNKSRDTSNAFHVSRSAARPRSRGDRAGKFRDGGTSFYLGVNIVCRPLWALLEIAQAVQIFRVRARGLLQLIFLALLRSNSA